MKQSISCLAVALALWLSLPNAALAEAPAFVPVQAYLTDAEGVPLEGELAIHLTLYDTDTAGEALFEESQQVWVEAGLVTVYLGSQGTLDLALFRDNSHLFLGVRLGSDPQEPEMTPRLPLGSIPYAGYAEYAGDAASLQGHAATDFRLLADPVDWSDLGSVPDGLADGDADTLAGLTCTSGKVAKWNGSAWACADDVDTDTDTDTLAGIACGVDQVIKWDGLGWVCADDTDTSLTEDEVDAMVGNNGYALAAELAAVASTGSFLDLTDVPAELSDGDADTLAGLTCADGQLPAWDDTNAVWECVDDLDTDTLATLACADGQLVKWDDINSVWTCADDIDTDTTLTEADVDAMVADNGYALTIDLATVASSGSFSDLVNVPAGLADGDADTLAGISCGSGQVIKWNGTAWACADDIDTDTTLTEADVDAMVADNGYALNVDLAAVASSGSFSDLVNVPAGLADGDADTLAGISCGSGQVIKWNGTAWACADDIDTTLTEADVDAMVADNGYALTADLAAVASSGSFNDLVNVPAGLADGDSDTLAGLGCANGQVAKWAGASWICANDVDTNSGGDITEVLTPAGSGLLGGTDTGSVALQVAFGGTGGADTVARSDHNHDAAYVFKAGDTMTGPLVLPENGLAVGPTGQINTAGGNVGIGTTLHGAGLRMTVEGNVGASAYCDRNGANCVQAQNMVQTLSCTTASATSLATNYAVATCPAGYTMVGGGCTTIPGDNAALFASQPAGNGWSCTEDPPSVGVTAYARCCTLLP